MATHWEYDFTDLPSGNEIEVTFPVPRRPLAIVVWIKTSKPFAIDKYSCDSGDGYRDLGFAVNYREKDGGYLAKIALVDAPLTKRVKFALRGQLGKVQYAVNIAVVEDHYDDYVILQDAFSFVERKKLADAVRRLKDYIKITPHNPRVLELLSHTYRDLKEYELAAQAALKAAANGRSDEGIALFREIEEVRPFDEVEDLRQLQESARSWEIDGHHGMLLLKNEKRFQLGLDHWYLMRYHAVMEVRRMLAARMMRRLDYSYTSHDVFLHTRMRVIRADGSVEKLDYDKLSLSDNPNRNIFIQSRVDRIATWMLHDIQPGDLIEWDVAIAQRERRSINGRPHLFILSTLNNCFFPTYQSVLQFSAPAEWKVRLSTINTETDPVIDEEPESGSRRYRYSASKFVPANESGANYEEYLLNPTVGCAVGPDTWHQLTPELMKLEVGSDIFEDDLPGMLGEMVAADKPPLTILEEIFYWVRDKVKYGAFEAADARVGTPERLKAIVEGGFGDCKDKAFLLRQVCHKLNIPCAFALVSSGNGVVFDDLPADQFDHVFLAYRNGDDWGFLDASGTANVFGLPPAHLQGMKALIDHDGGRIITLPEDRPDQNAIEIAEVFNSVSSNWLSGKFNIRALGRSARMLDETWKVYSLRQGDLSHAISQALSRNMPRISPEDTERTSHTGESNVFAANGTHRRCQLSELNGKLVGTLTWDEPSLLLQDWRYLCTDRFAAFQLPIKLNFRCEITGDARLRLTDISSPAEFENDLCRVCGSLVEDTDRVVYASSITVKKLFVPLEQEPQVPPAMRNIEKAMRMAVILSA